MNTLRKLKGQLRTRSYQHSDCDTCKELRETADELASTLPAWERLEKAVENSLRARGGGKKDCGHDFECICPDDELRKALEGVKA